MVAKVTAAALARVSQKQVLPPSPCQPQSLVGVQGGGGACPGSYAHIRESCRWLELLLPTMGSWALSGCSGWTSSPSSGEGGMMGA